MKKNIRILIVLVLSWSSVSIYAIDYAQKARFFQERAEQHRRAIVLQRTTHFFCKQDARYYTRVGKRYRRRANYCLRRGKLERAARLNGIADEAFAKAEQKRLKSQLALDSIDIYTIWANNMEQIAFQCFFIAAAEEFEQQLKQQQNEEGIIVKPEGEE